MVILAKLEIMLPLYWNTSTRHFLLHIFEFIERFGNVWSFSMLGVERIHVMIKKLGKSKRNIMTSIRKHNDLLVHSQLDWRYKKGHSWSTKARQSSFQMKRPVPERQHLVQPKGAMTEIEVDPVVFKYLQDAWTAVNPGFREFRDQYYVTYLRNCKRKKQEPVPFSVWRVTGNTPEQQRYVLNVDRRCIVLPTTLF